MNRTIADQIVLTGLPGFAGGLAVAFGVFAAINSVKLPPALTLPVVTANLIVAAVLTGVWTVTTRGRLSARWSHPLAAGLLLLATGNVLLTFSLVGETLQNNFVSLLVIAAGAWLLARPWLFGTIGIMVVAWTPVAWRAAASTNTFMHYGLTLLASVFLCLAIHASRLRIHQRLGAAQQDLEASEERYRKIFEQSKDIVAMSTPDGRLLDINQTGLEVFGLGSKEEARQIDIGRDLYADPQQRQTLMQTLREDGFVQDLASTLKSRSGRLIQIEGTTSTITDDNGETLAFLSILRDVTQRKQIEEELDRYRQQLEVLVAARTRALEEEISERLRLEKRVQQAHKLESLGVLAGGIAHDFNNLLATMSGHTDLLLLQLPADSPYREQVKPIQTATQHAAALTREILAFARHGEFEFEACHLDALVVELTDLLRASISQQATLELEIADDLPSIRADATRLRQVVMNLILNASDALGTAVGTISVTLNAAMLRTAPTFLDRELPPGYYARLQVEDTGCGMDEETRQKIFDPFFTTKRTGRGLGLASVLGIVHSHEGAIEVHSKPHQGTRFTVLLPVAAAQHSTQH